MMTEEQMSILEKMFPDGFLIISGDKSGQFGYAKYNPKRVHLLEAWEQTIKTEAENASKEYWKGFTSSDDIPDNIPKEWL